MIKAVFFDIDGTLLSNKNNKVPESTKLALDLLKQNGIKRFIATGRHFLEIEGLDIADIDFDGYILLTGQLVFDGARNVIYSRPIHKADSEVLIKHFNDKDIPIMMVEKDRLYINYVNQNVKDAQYALKVEVPNIESYHGDLIYQASVFASKTTEKALLSEMSSSKSTRWNDYGIDIIDAEGGKRHGIHKILEHFNISEEETMAFGDGENDIDMLQTAKIAVAMGNAIDDLKKHADYITDNLEDDGIYNALKHFNLI